MASTGHSFDVNFSVEFSKNVLDLMRSTVKTANTAHRMESMLVIAIGTGHRDSPIAAMRYLGCTLSPYSKLQYVPRLPNKSSKVYILRLKELLRRRLVECGWRDEVKLICKEIIKENGQDITYDALLSMATSRARSRVPDVVKKELLQKIKGQLLAQEEKLKT